MKKPFWLYKPSSATKGMRFVQLFCFLPIHNFQEQSLTTQQSEIEKKLFFFQRVCIVSFDEYIFFNGVSTNIWLNAKKLHKIYSFSNWSKSFFYKMKKHFYLLYMNGGEFINWFLNLCLIFEQATMSNNIH